MPAISLTEEEREELFRAIDRPHIPDVHPQGLSEDEEVAYVADVTGINEAATYQIVRSYRRMTIEQKLEKVLLESRSRTANMSVFNPYATNLKTKNEETFMAGVAIFGSILVGLVVYEYAPSVLFNLIGYFAFCEADVCPRDQFVFGFMGLVAPTMMCWGAMSLTKGLSGDSLVAVCTLSIPLALWAGRLVSSQLYSFATIMLSLMVAATHVRVWLWLNFMHYVIVVVCMFEPLAHHTYGGQWNGLGVLIYYGVAILYGVFYLVSIDDPSAHVCPLYWQAASYAQCNGHQVGEYYRAPRRRRDNSYRHRSHSRRSFQHRKIPTSILAAAPIKRLFEKHANSDVVASGVGRGRATTTVAARIMVGHLACVVIERLVRVANPLVLAEHKSMLKVTHLTAALEIVTCDRTVAAAVHASASAAVEARAEHPRGYVELPNRKYLRVIKKLSVGERAGVTVGIYASAVAQWLIERVILRSYEIAARTNTSKVTPVHVEAAVTQDGALRAWFGNSVACLGTLPGSTPLPRTAVDMLATHMSVSPSSKGFVRALQAEIYDIILSDVMAVARGCVLALLATNRKTVLYRDALAGVAMCDEHIVLRFNELKYMPSTARFYGYGDDMMVSWKKFRVIAREIATRAGAACTATAVYERGFTVKWSEKALGVLMEYARIVLCREWKRVIDATLRGESVGKNGHMLSVRALVAVVRERM